MSKALRLALLFACYGDWEPEFTGLDHRASTAHHPAEIKGSAHWNVCNWSNWGALQSGREADRRMRTSLFLLLLCLVVGTPTQGKEHAKGSSGV